MNQQCKQVPKTKEDEIKGWVTVNLHNQDETQLEGQVILDTGETFNSFKDCEYLNNGQSGDVSMKMRINVGTRKINKEGTVPGLKSKVWLDEKSIANIFSFVELSQQYHIKYDNDVENAFL